MSSNGPASTACRLSLPLSSHKPAAYTGPSREEVIALRREYLTPALITYYKEPLLLVEGHMQYGSSEKFCNTTSKEDASQQTGITRHSVQLVLSHVFQFGFCLCLVPLEFLMF